MKDTIPALIDRVGYRLWVILQDHRIGQLPVNYETNQVYALHGVIHIQTESEETVAWAEAYMRLDYEAVVEEE